MSNEIQSEITRISGGVSTDAQLDANDLSQPDIEGDDYTAVITKIQNDGMAIIFTYIEDETSTMEASITDNWVETNHTVQDHIAVKPRIYRLRGCVGEVVYVGTSEWMKKINEKINQNPILQKTINVLKPIASISGVVSNATQAAINVVNQLESSYNRYRKMIEDNLITSKKRKILNQKQETVVAWLNRILETRTEVTLKGLRFEKTLTKGDNFERKYYLQSVSAHQGNNGYITDIEVTIKEFRIATTAITQLDQKYAEPVNQMKTAEVDQGQARGVEPETKISDVPVIKQIQQAAKSATEGQTIPGKIIQKTCNSIMTPNSFLIKMPLGQFALDVGTKLFQYGTGIAGNLGRMWK